MSDFLQGFVGGISNSVSQQLQQKHDQDQKDRDNNRAFWEKVVFDQSGTFDENDKKIALGQYEKAAGPQAKKFLSQNAPIMQAIHKLGGVFNRGQQPGQAGQPGQPGQPGQGQQPSPMAQLNPQRGGPISPPAPGTFTAGGGAPAAAAAPPAGYRDDEGNWVSAPTTAAAGGAGGTAPAAGLGALVGAPGGLPQTPTAGGTGLPQGTAPPAGTPTAKNQYNQGPPFFSRPGAGSPGDTAQTAIPANRQNEYQAWLQQQSQQVGRDISGDTKDYDLQGAFLAGEGAGPNGHFTDRFKKPNHPTFSTDSKYSGQNGEVGGKWVQDKQGKWTFYASPANLKYHSAAELQQYFRQSEPDAKLVMPSKAAKERFNATPPPPSPYQMLHPVGADTVAAREEARRQAAYRKQLETAGDVKEQEDAKARARRQQEVNALPEAVRKGIDPIELMDFVDTGKAITQRSQYKADSLARAYDIRDRIGGDNPPTQAEVKWANDKIDEEDRKLHPPAKTTAGAEKRAQLVKSMAEAYDISPEEAEKRVAKLEADKAAADVRAAEARGTPKLTEEDKMARYFIDSGRETDPAKAKAKASDMLIKLSEAKLRAAQGGGAGALSPVQLQALAQWNIATGQQPSFGRGANDPNRIAYERALAGLLTGNEALGQALGTRATVKDTQLALNDAVKRREQSTAAEGTAEKVLQRALQNSRTVTRTGSSLVNDYLLYAQGKIQDYPELARFRDDVNTAVNEYARLMVSATGGGTTTDSARKEAEVILNTHMGQGSFEAAVDEMQANMRGRMQTLNDVVGQLQQDMTGAPAPKGTTTPPATNKPKVKILEIKPVP